MKKKHKQKRGRAAWIGQGDAADDLLNAACQYIEGRGGKVLAIGPIELQHWPEDRKYIVGWNSFRLAVRFMGRAPKKPGSKALKLP